MRQRLAIVLVTVLAFAIGLGAGVWVEKHQPLPPPPAMPGSEFARHHASFPNGYRRGPIPTRQELRRQIEALRPEIETFQRKMAAIDDAFDLDFDALLNPTQRAVHAGHFKRVQDERNRLNQNGKEADDRLLDALADISTRSILWDVVVPLRLDRLTEFYKLDDLQREKVRALLVTRRQKVIELIDSAPPPTVMLRRLAPMVQRAAHPDAPAKP